MPRHTASASSASLYPIVQDLTEEEYGQARGMCCCPNTTTGNLLNSSSSSLGFSNNPCAKLSKWLPSSSVSQHKQPQKMQQRSLPMQEHSPNLPNKSLSHARKAFPLMDMCVTNTFSSDGGVDGENAQPTFENTYVLTRQIFRCDSSQVWECVHRVLGHRFAVKIMEPLPLLSPKNRGGHDTDDEEEKDEVMHEVGILKSIQVHPNIVEVVDVLRDDVSKRTHVVMELLTGGNLLSRVIQEQGLEESNVRHIMYSVLSGLAHIHAQGICHNDLQPSNILLDSSDGAKLADFGKAIRTFDVSIFSIPPLGRRNIVYTAPEVLQGGHATTASDMWSFGVITYFCLAGRPPFVDQISGRPLLSLINKADYSFPYYMEISRPAKQLISNLLHTDPTVRLTAEEALEHPWFAPRMANADLNASFSSSLSMIPSTLICMNGNTGNIATRRIETSDEDHHQKTTKSVTTLGQMRGLARDNAGKEQHTHPSLLTSFLMKFSMFPELVKNFGSSLLTAIKPWMFILATTVHGGMFTLLWTWLGVDSAFEVQTSPMSDVVDSVSTPGGVSGLQIALFTAAIVGFVLTPLAMAWWVRDLKRLASERNLSKSMPQTNHK